MKNSTSRLHNVIAACLLIVLIGFSSHSAAQIKNTKLKVSQDLLQLSVKFTSATKTIPALKNLPAIERKDDYIMTAKGEVLIQIIAENSGDRIISDLEDIGFKKSGMYKRVINGFIPVESIPMLNNIKELVYASPTHKPINNSGIAVTNGDTAMQSYIARSNLGIDGTGSKIGVLSDSYNSLLTADSGIVSGDLPGAANPYGYTSEIDVLADVTYGSDEGRGMMEIIHDVAPGAELAFYTAYNGQADFAQGIIALAEAGCNIIVDDVSYFSEPFFTDGIIAQAAEEATKKYKVAYYSSAGNAANQSYESNFSTTGDTLFLANPYFGYTYGNYIMHDFDPGPGVDYFQEIVFPPGYSLKYAFQWDEPYASADENSPGCSSDMDIFLAMEKHPQAILLESAYNNLQSDPYEYIGVTNTGTDTLSAYIAIGKWIDAEGDNPNPGVIKAINFGEALFGEYDTQSPTVMGHSNGKYVNSIGAAPWWRTPAYAPVYGYDTAIAEGFSSLGGIPILMKPNGKKYRHPKIRRNPDFVAPDGGNTSFFGFPLNDGDNFPNFFGTSASAPHAAAVHALLNEIANNKIRNNFIEYCLLSTTSDMDNPYTAGFDVNYDYVTGYGFLQADKAAEKLMMFTFEPLMVYATCSDNPKEIRNWIIINPNTFNVTLNWELFGTNQSGSFVAAPGENTLTTSTAKFYNLLLVSSDIGSLTYYDAAYSKGKPCNVLKSTGDDDMLTSVDNLQVVTQIYPNPVITEINVNVFTENSERIYATVYQMNGSIAYEKAFKAEDGFNKFKIDATELENGTYVLRITNSKGILLESSNIVKQ